MAREPREAREEEPEEQGEEGHKASLAGLCTDFFLLGLQIRGGHLELPPCETLRRRVLQLFEVLRGKAQRGGVLPADVDDARYALAAYLDEMIHYSDWPGKAEWASKPLQAVLFNETKLGARFFERLAEVRRRSPAGVEVFYQCLVLGFQGEYRISGQQEFDELVEDLRRELTAGMGKVLSLHGKPPEARSLGGKALPLIPIAVACVLLAVLVVTALYFVLGASQTDAVELLNQIGRG